MNPGYSKKYHQNTALKTLFQPENLNSLTVEETQFLKRHRIFSFIAFKCVSVLNDKNKRILQKNRMHMMHLSSEILSVDQLFKENNISLLHLKGPVLAQYLYQDIAPKESRDIDILIPANKIPEAEALLYKKGYKRIYPDFSLTPVQKKRFIKTTHHYTFFHPDTRIVFELHWGFFTPENLYPKKMEEVFKNKQEVLFFGKQLYMPDNETLTFYLMLHGARHQWFRIIWLLDYNALLKKSNHNPEKLQKKADERKLTSVFNSSLLLCNEILKTNYSIKTISKNTISLYRSSKKAMFQDAEKRNAFGVSKFKKLFYYLRLKKDFSYWCHVVVRVISNQSDWKVLPLPDKLFFLYVPLKPLLWLIALVRKKSASKP